MRVVSAPGHLEHVPGHEYKDGRAIANYEVPERAETIRRALEADGGFAIEPPTEHGAEPIAAVHDPAMLAYLEGAWAAWVAAGEKAVEILPDTFPLPAYHEGMEPPAGAGHPRAQVGGWVFDASSPIVEGTYRAARAAVDVALTAADLVTGGERSAYGLCRPPGHHAARGMMGGYCYFNNAAIVAEHLARSTGGRVAILDVDYHHGNGTQQIFYARGDVLYVSLHGDPARAYPYSSGFADETGAGGGVGATLNLPLAKGCDDHDYLAALDRALEAVGAFGEAPLVVSLGMDTYGRDPICDLALTTEGYALVGGRVAELGRPTVVLQEGGYFVPDLGQNVRAWLRGFEGATA
ncbi:MAG TPA: histone deacetylase family protein [Gemmatimonadota bacterium]|nr:histone deacetylase family protein [Gemmatimonadota bacterium]